MGRLKTKTKCLYTLDVQACCVERINVLAESPKKAIAAATRKMRERLRKNECKHELTMQDAVDESEE